MSAMVEDKGKDLKVSANDKGKDVDTSSFAPMVIERMNKQYQTVSGRSKCNKQGGLYPGRVPYIVDVRVVWFAATGAYCAKDLQRNPHYQLPPASIEGFESDCDAAGLRVHKFRNSLPWKSDDCLAVANCIKGQNGELESLIDQLRLDLIFSEYKKEVLNTGTDISKTPDYNPLRNASQQHFGFTGGHSLSKKNEKNAPRPQQIKGTNDDPLVATRFAVMTQIADLIFKDARASSLREGSGGVIYGDPHRNEIFSNTIHKNNRIEALTQSTASQFNFLFIHIDVLNDGSSKGRRFGYQYVVCAWRIYPMPDGTLVRVTLLAYSRKGICDSLYREDVCQDYIDEELAPWLQKLPYFRKMVKPDGRLFQRNFVKQGILDSDSPHLFLAPILNKHAGYLSAFVDLYFKVCRTTIPVFTLSCKSPTNKLCADWFVFLYTDC